MLDFKTFCQVTSLMQVSSIRDEDMDQSLKDIYQKYLDYDPEQRLYVEEKMRDAIIEPAHMIVNFYNDSEKTGNK